MKRHQLAIWRWKTGIIAAISVFGSLAAGMASEGKNAHLTPGFFAELEAFPKSSPMPEGFEKEFAKRFVEAVLADMPQREQVVGETMNCLRAMPGLDCPTVLPVLETAVREFATQAPQKCGAITGCLIAALPPNYSPQYGPEILGALCDRIKNTQPRFVVSTLNDCYSYLRWFHPECIEVMDAMALSKSAQIDKRTELRGKSVVRLFVTEIGRLYGLPGSENSIQPEAGGRADGSGTLFAFVDSSNSGLGSDYEAVPRYFLQDAPISNSGTEAPLGQPVGGVVPMSAPAISVLPSGHPKSSS